MMKNILITATNQPYFEACITLIASIHRTSLDCVDQIIVYNLGLNQESVIHLNKLHLVTVEDLFKHKDKFYEGFFDTQHYAFKLFCQVDAKKFGKNIFWLDSGALFLKNCRSVFEKIEENHIFCVEDRDKHINRRWTHEKAVKILEATENELDSFQLCAGIFGYKVGGRYEHVIDEAFKFALIKDCIQGSRNNHRHDQSILSILTYRYSCPREDMSIYGEWDNYIRAKKSGNVVIFVHRRGVKDHSGLIFD